LRFFGFLRLTGALGGRTLDGEMPPVRALPERVPAGAVGPVPPLWLELGALPAPEGTDVPPVAADALLAPTANATRSTASAKVRRTR
jgi:hypothetical protein